MVHEGLVAAYAICTGFVLSGLIGSFYQMVTREPVAFKLSVETWLSGFMSILLCGFAGPFIIMRNAVRGRRIEHRPLLWMAASASIAGVWSFCSGVVFLQFAVAVYDSVAI